MTSVERLPVELEVGNIAINEAKAAYIQTKSVQVDDVGEVLGNLPKFFVTIVEGRRRVAMIGPNRSGCFLLVPIRHVEGTDYRLISAYWLARDRGQKIYEELG
jgi:hypothetical protein